MNGVVKINKCSVNKVMRVVHDTKNAYSVCLFTANYTKQAEAFPDNIQKYGTTALFKVSSYHLPAKLLGKISFNLEGHWEKDTHGTKGDEKIFVAEKASESMPETRAEIIKFLMNSSKGVGKVTAETIYNKFGNETLDICAHKPRRLRDIPKMTEQMLGNINAACLSALVRADVQILLGKAELEVSVINQIVEAYGDEATTVLKSEPYKLVRLLGFSTTDHIAMSMGEEPNSERRLRAATMNSATIHKACGLVPADNPSGFKAQGECRICGFVGIDEMSMVGEHLFAFAVDAVLNSPSTRIVLLGDTDQLAPVSRGDVLRDLIECGVIKTVRLDVNYRQGSTSTITDASIKIRENRAYSGMTRNLRFDDEFNFISVTDPDEKTEADKIMKTIVEEYRKGVAQYGMQGTIVLTPTHYDKGTPTGYLCKNRVNVEIQAAVNPKTDGKPFYEVNHQTFMAGDRVIQRKNTEAVINGDLGTVQEILKDDDGVRVCILFDSKNEVLTYDSNDMKNVELAYAITVHSSQGCEFPCCIFPVSSSYGPMLTKPLYYTGITRAKKKLVMIGDEEALKKAVRTTRTQGRKSLLGPRIIKRLRNM